MFHEILPGSYSETVIRSILRILLKFRKIKWVLDHRGEACLRMSSSIAQEKPAPWHHHSPPNILVEPLAPWYLIRAEPDFMSNYTPCKMRRRRRCLIRFCLSLGFL